MILSTKMQTCFEIINELPKKFVKNEQTVDAQEYLLKNFDCINIPLDILNFLTLTDGINIGFASFYSVSKQNKSIPALTFEEYSNEEENFNFSNAFNLATKTEKYFFFGEDGKMGKFAFIKNIPHYNKVYHFKLGITNEVAEYGTFADLLLELLLQNL